MLIVLLVQMERMMQDEINLKDRVIQLHEIARHVEQEVGCGVLAKTLRETADKLEVLNSREFHEEQCGK